VRQQERGELRVQLAVCFSGIDESKTWGCGCEREGLCVGRAPAGIFFERLRYRLACPSRALETGLALVLLLTVVLQPFSLRQRTENSTGFLA